jgi:hypothetical protein
MRSIAFYWSVIADFLIERFPCARVPLGSKAAVVIARQVPAVHQRGGRGMLPVHLPRVDVVIDVESKICPCCGGALHTRTDQPDELRADTDDESLRPDAIRSWTLTMRSVPS